jgi:alpha-1,6-mannosyltransferase
VLAGFERDRGRLAAAVASADALVHGCPHETFGLGVAEALATGLPVVVPDAGGAAEVADAACSEVYATGDARACARAVTSILARVARGRAELSAAAVAAAARVPTIEAQFAHAYEVYSELLSSRA